MQLDLIGTLWYGMSSFTREVGSEQHCGQVSGLAHRCRFKRELVARRRLPEHLAQLVELAWTKENNKKTPKVCDTLMHAMSGIQGMEEEVVAVPLGFVMATGGSVVGSSATPCSVSLMNASKAAWSTNTNDAEVSARRKEAHV